MTDDKLRVLFVAHNHPAIRPGGAEQFALELYEGMKLHAGIEPMLLCGAACPEKGIAKINDDPNQWLLHYDPGTWDHIFCTHSKNRGAVEAFIKFIKAFKPDVIHFQHTHLLGYELVSAARTAFPHILIVYTLHEFLPICVANGQMLDKAGMRCTSPVPAKCARCRPGATPEKIVRREHFIRNRLAPVNIFIAPSRFLADIYHQWGLEDERLCYIEYGRKGLSIPAPRTLSRGERRNRFAYFGQLLPSKGIIVVLEAMAGLDPEIFGDVRFSIHGANLERQPRNFQKKFKDLLSKTDHAVIAEGPYDSDDLASLMARTDWVIVPSLWWENSPLVIQEAFMCRRPVICSDIGGMAEKVRHEIDGLHFVSGSISSLQKTIERALTEPSLWDRLRNGIDEIFPLDSCVQRHIELYQGLLNKKPVAWMGAHNRNYGLPPEERKACPILITGAARSGTTALRDGLCEGASLSGTREGHVLPLIDALLKCRTNYCDDLSDEIRANFDNHLINMIDMNALDETILSFFRSSLERSCKGDWFVLKTPNHLAIRAIPTLGRIYPDYRIIHVRRRGIEVVLSRHRKFPKIPFEESCQVWANCVRAWNDIKPSLDTGCYLEIEHQTLCLEPLETARRICQFLGLPHVKANNINAVWSGTRPQMTTMQPDHRTVGIDETGWTKEQMDIFLSTCGSLMADCGYSMDGGIVPGYEKAPVGLYYIYPSPLTKHLLTISKNEEKRYCSFGVTRGFSLHIESEPISITYQNIYLSGHRSFTAKISVAGNRKNGAVLIELTVKGTGMKEKASVSVQVGRSLDWFVPLSPMDGFFDITISVRPAANSLSGMHMWTNWQGSRFIV